MLIKSTLILTTLAFSSLLANDTYILSYSKEHNCTLRKNGTSIELFDKRFEKKAPKSAYTCSAIQKEQYNNCKIISTKNTTAQFFGFGSYEYTNLILAFQNPSKSVNSSMEVLCTKDLTKN